MVEDEKVSLVDLCPNIIENVSKAPFMADALNTIPKKYRDKLIAAVGYGYLLGYLDGSGALDG